VISGTDRPAAGERGEIKGGRDQDEAGDADALIGRQRLGETRAAEAAIAFADDELGEATARRRPASDGSSREASTSPSTDQKRRRGSSPAATMRL